MSRKEEAKTLSLGKPKRAKRGVGTIIGAAFVIMILLSGFAFYSLILNNIDNYNKSASEANASELNKNTEQLVISSIQITSANKLSLTVKNTGSVSSRLLWLGIFNRTAIPEWQRFANLSKHIEPAENASILPADLPADFIITQGPEYIIQLVTEAGNVFSSKFYPANEVNCALSLIAASPTTYAGNNVTVMLTVTLNDTDVDIVQNITASIRVSPTGLVGLVGNSPLTVTGLASGESAFFWWIYNTNNTGIVTFNASYSSAPLGSFVLTNVTILATPGQSGGSSNVVINGVNGTGEYNPSQLNPLGGTQTVSGSVASLSANDSNYAIFSSYYTGSTVDINHFVDNNSSNVDGTANIGTHSDFTAQKVGPDSIYDTLTEAGSTATNTYNPSSYGLLGSTQLVSGTVTGLQTDNGVYMTFRSYVSATSATSKTDAFIAYRSNTLSGLSFPKNRLWDGDTTVWGIENELATANSPVRWVRTAVCPISERALEKIVVTLSDDGYLDAYVWDGTSWNVTNNIGYVGTTANAYQCFDIAYETTSGEALLVYGISSTNTAQDLAYRTWASGIGWSSEYYIDDNGHSTDIQYYWVMLASKPTSGSNEITMVALDGTDSDGNGWVWNGSSWGSIYELDATVSITSKECIAVAYESQSGVAWTAVGSGSTANTFSMRSQTGGTWNATKTNLNVGGVPNWCTLKPDPASNKLMLVSVDGSSDLNTVYWSGSGTWIVQTEHDASVDTNAQRCADFAWEPTGSKGLLVWGTTSGSISRKTFTAPSTWGSETTTAYSGTKAWIQLRTNTRSVGGDAKILGAVLNSAFDIGAIKWDGTTFTIIGEATLTSDTTVVTYECFEMEFNGFGDPTEFTSAVEFTGTSNTELLTQLTWTIDSSYTTSGVTTTFQLYNYTAGAYSASGYGYMADTIGTTNMTMTQTITVNPNQFNDASGNWKLKVTGIKTTTSDFNWQGDLVAYAPLITNYELDMEIQWTNVDFSQTNEWLNIYCGTMAAENLHVDVWDGSSWHTIITPLYSGWNNVSVSSYLASSNFTIRFKDASKDTSQDSWNIDVALLHLWTTTDQYTATAEFTGSSNLQNWTSVLWQIQSCWDIGQVSVSIQLYNFTLGDYASTGNGYLSYTSTATANTNQMQSKSETSSPNDFKNTTGYWRIKITGVKTTNVQFLMKIDWIDIQTTYSTNGDTIPLTAWQLYSIKANTTTGNPIPYAYVAIFTNDSNIAFKNATDANMTNPVWVYLDVSGTYLIKVNAANATSQTFVIYAVIGSIVGQKTVTKGP